MRARLPLLHCRKFQKRRLRAQRGNEGSGVKSSIFLAIRSPGSSYSPLSMEGLGPRSLVLGLDSARGRELGDAELEAGGGGENSNLCGSSEQISCVLQGTGDGQT